MYVFSPSVVSSIANILYILQTFCIYEFLNLHICALLYGCVLLFLYTLKSILGEIISAVTHLLCQAGLPGNWQKGGRLHCTAQIHKYTDTQIHKYKKDTRNEDDKKTDSKLIQKQ